MPRGRLMSCCYRRVHGIISMPDSQIAFGRDINAQRRFAEIIVQTKKKLHAEAYNSLILMRILAPRPGLEPGTCGLTVRRSTS
jgi:hypothetical protein